MRRSEQSRIRPEEAVRPDAGASPADGRGVDPGAGTASRTHLLFLLSLTVLACAYTVMAFGMEWRVEAGQIGPGFFPRLVGGATVLGCLVAIARCLRGNGASSDSPAPGLDADGEADPVGEGDRSGTDLRVTLLALAFMVLFYVVFEPLGALLASVLFLGLTLTVVNRAHHRLNAAVSVLVPGALYLLFEIALDAGLPPGLVLPL